MNYKWNILSKANNMQDVLRNILEWKNIPKEKVREFIDFKMEPHDPFLLTNMDKAVERMNAAKANGEKVCIIGDYDADGITATSVMYIGLRNLGINVIWQIPDRFKDGYGMNKRLIDNANTDSCKLIITVDNGIAAREQIEYAKSLGIDVIVTDHHQAIDGVPTEITVNPQIDDAYPFKCICGCMVAFKFIQAMLPNMWLDDPDLYEELVSIATIGTIADVMELQDENRFYVKQGLQFLSKPRNIGLRTLCHKLNLYGKELSADDVGFLIGPCLNAAGRLDSPDIAANLLLCDDNVDADRFATKIIQLNDKRKTMQKQVVDSIKVSEDDDFIIVHSDGIGHGILGIIAGNIAEKYQRPCFVLGGSEEKNKLSGSGRSVYGYDINSCVQANSDIATGGGHAAACGVSLTFDNFAEFKKRCNEHFRTWRQNTSLDDMTPQLDVACEIDINIINDRLIKNVTRLEPYGNGNEEPVFCTMDLKVESFKVVGKNANVLQMTLSKDGSKIKTVGFNNVKQKFDELNNPTEVDVLYKISLNEWPEGVFTPQLKIEDIRITK